MIPLEKTAQVWGIYGNLGGGKTLTAVSMAVDALSKGYFVCTNITLDIDLISKRFSWAKQLYKHIVVRNDEYDEEGNLIKSEDFNPFKIPSGSPRGSDGNKRVLVILDECAEWFDQYSNLKSKSISRVMSWLRHSSKRSQDVVFIVQRREYLNKSFRILVSRWVSVVDLATFRLPVLKCHIPFMGGFVFSLVLDKVGNTVVPARLVSKSKFGQYYNTAECLSTYGGASFEYDKPPPQSFAYGFWFLLYFGSLFYLFFIV